MNRELTKRMLESDAHYFVKCDLVSRYKERFELSERAAADHLDIPKSNVHRMLSVAKTDPELRKAAEAHGTDFYTLVVFHECNKEIKSDLRARIIAGMVVRHKDAKEAVKFYKAVA